MKAIQLLIAAALLAPAAFAGETCAPNALQILKNPKANIDLRTKAGTCVVLNELGRSEVAHAVLHIIRDGREDLFLREDLIEALSNAPLRRVVRVEEELAPEIGKEEKENLDRTLASRSASSLIELAQSVKSMGETLPVTKLEGEFFRTLSEIAEEDRNHVILRESAVGALEKMSLRVVDSGIYDEKTLRDSREALWAVAGRDDIASYFSGAGDAYQRLSTAGMPGYMVASKQAAAGRVISSVKPVLAK